MRSCDETLELISAALDGTLTGDEQAALDEHLSRCPACSALFAELKSLREAAAELEEVPAPAGFSGRVMDAIAADPVQEQPDNVVPFPVKKRSRAPWKGWAATAAVVAVVALGAVTLPGQLGAGSKSSTADCAASVQAQDTGAAPTEEGGTAKAESFAMTASDDNGAARAGGAATEPESAVADSSSNAIENSDGNPEVQDMFPSVNATSLPSPAESSSASCGTITLTGGPLPEGLANDEYTEDAEGNRTYEVPAESFFTYLEALEAEQPGGFTYDPGQEDAEYGQIIVRVPA